MDQGTRDRVIKMMTLAMDASSPLGEKQAAMLGIVRTALANCKSAVEFFACMHEGKAKQQEQPKESGRSEQSQRQKEFAKRLTKARLVKMWFGKHLGETLGWIEHNDPEYMIWMYENLDQSKSRTLLSHIEVILQANGAFD